MKKLISILLMLAAVQVTFAAKEHNQELQPKLIVGIVVDQMRMIISTVFTASTAMADSNG